MKTSLSRWGTALLASLAIAGCGGGGGGGGDAPVAGTPVTGTAVNTAIVAASAVLANDTATNTSSAFTVLQTAGVPAVVINSPPVVNFTVFSDGAVLQGLKLDTKAPNNVRVALAKLIPGASGNPDEWVSYVTRTKTATTGLKLTSIQATTDPYQTDATLLAGQLVYNADGYYTYTFRTDVKANPAYDDTKTHRVVLQLSYVNKAGVTVKVNPYFDFTLAKDTAGKAIAVMASAAQTRKMTDVDSCNSCHENLALHGGGRVDTQYCVVCHNPGTTDPVSGNVVTLSTMVHKLHAGKRLAAAGDSYSISSWNADEIGFPQDLRNCTKCHTAANTATPQGDNWKTSVSKQACLSCHTAKVGGAWETKHVVYAKDPVVVGAASATNTKATDLTNAQCVACHKVGSNISSEVVHWNQNEENSPKYKMIIESATVVKDANSVITGVEINYFLSDPTNSNAAYDLITADCTAGPTCANTTKFGNLRFYLGYQNMIGQSTTETEFSANNNGGSGANAYAYKGTNVGGNHYKVTIPVPADVAGISKAFGTARVISIGQIKEPQLELKSLDPRPAVVPAALVSVVVQNTHFDVALTGALQPRRAVVSNAKCNACHGSLGSTSGANTLANAFHGGARDTVEACAVCHDANKVSTTVMTNGLVFNESYQFKRMIHGIHGNSKRVSPFTHGNTVVGAFCNPAGTTPAALAQCAAVKAAGMPILALTGVENYAAEVAYPGVGLNCNACHINDSYKQDRGTLGAPIVSTSLSKDKVTGVFTSTTVAKFETSGACLGATGTVAANTLACPGGVDLMKLPVISPKAASCTACHDSSAAMGHVTSFGGSSFGNKTQADIAAMPRETCNDCHASGGFKGVDIVHGQK